MLRLPAMFTLLMALFRVPLLPFPYIVSLPGLSSRKHGAALRHAALAAYAPVSLRAQMDVNPPKTPLSLPLRRSAAREWSGVTSSALIVLIVLARLMVMAASRQRPATGQCSSQPRLPASER